VALAGGALAALFYHRLGLTLSHYDARGHLIVARRIADSITPGWQQIGAVWLPLPHLLNALPVQIDTFYRSGASAVAISTFAFAAAVAGIAWIVFALTESVAAAVAAALVFGLNPNVVYLQATPMTEPLLLALMVLGLALLIQWVGRGSGAGPDERTVGIVLALACLTRYEAWPVTYLALAAAAWARWRQGESADRIASAVGRMAAYPTVALLAFAVFSRVVVGRWFVSTDFFVPENKAQGLPLLAAAEIIWGATELSSQLLVALAGAGLLLLMTAGLARRRTAHFLLPVSLGATAAVPWSAFLDGHPFRIRYMVPLMAFQAVGAGTLAGWLGRRATPGRFQELAAALVVGGVAITTLHPLDTKAPMVVEAQWDRPNAPVRQQVTNCLRARYDGTSIMASMGSLGHYMQEASHDGFNLRDFLHEGNGDIWLAALEEPSPYAGWVLIEEKAEGGDMLAKKAREHPHFLDGYSRICEGAGLALYERQNRTLNVKR
jgi:4-amino-4-deoxy-L-arabinose transferase-like glycosyltransferase